MSLGRHGSVKTGVNFAGCYHKSLFSFRPNLLGNTLSEVCLKSIVTIVFNTILRAQRCFVAGTSNVAIGGHMSFVLHEDIGVVLKLRRE